MFEGKFPHVSWVWAFTWKTLQVYNFSSLIMFPVVGFMVQELLLELLNWMCHNKSKIKCIFLAGRTILFVYRPRRVWLFLIWKYDAGFEQAIQAYAVHVLSLTYQKVPRSVLAEVWIYKAFICHFTNLGVDSSTVIVFFRWCFGVYVAWHPTLLMMLRSIICHFFSAVCYKFQISLYCLFSFWHAIEDANQSTPTRLFLEFLLQSILFNAICSIFCCVF